MTRISNGGQLESLKTYDKVRDIVFVCEEAPTIHMWINDSSLSYLTVEEAVCLRNKLNEAIKVAVGV